MKSKFVLIFFACFAFSLAQEVTINQVYQWAKENYPVFQQKELLKQRTKLQINSTRKAYLPNVSLNGQATYQTDVTKIPFQLPNMPIDEMSKDQYKIVGEVKQLIYDGGEIQNKVEQLQLQELLQAQEVEINLYNLRTRISDLYFGILLIDKHLIQITYLEENIQTALDKAEVALENGITFKSSVNELKAELINSQQQRIDIAYNRKSLLTMLSELTGQSLNESTVFLMPQISAMEFENQRPELELLDLRKQLLETEKKKIEQHWHPQVSAFVQGGYGRPGLNMLDDDFQAFAIGGVRFIMPLRGFYTIKNEIEMLKIQSDWLDTEKDTFLLNTKISEEKEKSEVEKYEKMIEKDREIIDLRKDVLASAEAQLQNGVITSHEYINKLNATYLAEITRDLHEIQKLKAYYQQQIITGN